MGADDSASPISAALRGVLDWKGCQVQGLPTAQGTTGRGGSGHVEAMNRTMVGEY